MFSFIFENIITLISVSPLEVDFHRTCTYCGLLQELKRSGTWAMIKSSAQNVPVARVLKNITL